MTGPRDPFERLSAANPAPYLTSPDWTSIEDYIHRSTGTSKASLPPSVLPGGWSRWALPGWIVRRGGGTRVRIACAAAATAVAGGVVLVVAAPWSGSSSFIARAAAAVTPPPNEILYAEWETTFADPRLGITEPISNHELSQEWIDGASPHSYRLVLPIAREEDIEDPSLTGLAPDWEVGGTNEEWNTSMESLTFLPPDTLWATIGEDGPKPVSIPARQGGDPVAELQQALTQGDAQNEGATQLDGTTVDRIKLTLTGEAPNIAYVNPETLYPIEFEYNGPHVQTTQRFLHFEYLPATTANVELTSIQAQHPNATIASAATIEHGNSPSTGSGNPAAEQEADKAP